MFLMVLIYPHNGFGVLIPLQLLAAVRFQQYKCANTVTKLYINNKNKLRIFFKDKAELIHFAVSA
jgi:hypothetical protein